MSSSICSIIIRNDLSFLITEQSDQIFFEETYHHVLNIARTISENVIELVFDSTNKKSEERSFFHTKELVELLIPISEQYEHLMIFHDHTPFLDLQFTEELKSAHLKSLADYTFYDQYPNGLAPFAIYKEGLYLVLDSVMDSIYNPLSLEKAIKADLNQYDIEVLLAPSDFRFMKDDFFINNKRMLFLAKQIKDFWQPASLLWDTLQKHGNLFVGPPSFVEISLSGLRENQPIFLPPNSKEGAVLPFKDLKRFIEIIEKLNPQAIIQFSLIEGEPTLYPHFSDLLNLIQEHSHLKFILETEATHLYHYLERIGSIKNLKTVIYINACTKELYCEIHGVDFFDKVEGMLDHLMNHNQHNTYLQFVRMINNEEQLPLFFNRWKNFSSQIIISQYNHFGGLLPERKVIDLAPLHRFPCFKLQRELFLNSKKEITLCFQDYDNRSKQATLFTDEESVLSAIKVNGVHYHKQINNEYGKDPCSQSDSWYIFNA